MKGFRGAVLMGLVGIFLLAGCAGLARKERADELDQALKAYNLALRWGRYEDAARFCAPVDGQAQVIDEDFLGNIRVTAVEEKGKVIAEDGIEATTTIEYQFYHEYEGRVSKVLDHQTWRYDEKTERWRLDGNLPDFHRSR